MAGQETNSHHGEPSSFLNYSPEKIKHLKEKDLYLFYYNIIETENKLYTSGNTAEHKLIFLVGGPENDVTVAKDRIGRSIYTNPPNHPKLPEIPEATAAISDYFEKESSVVNVLSEIADVFHNLAALTKLDVTCSKLYKESINYLANSLSFPLNQANNKFSVNDGLLLGYLKFRRRLIDTGIKDHSGEDELIKQAITPKNGRNPLIHTPTNDGISQAFRAMNEIGNDVLRPRLIQIGRMDKWNGFKKNETVIFSLKNKTTHREIN